MASISCSQFLNFHNYPKNPISLSPSFVSPSFSPRFHSFCLAVKTSAEESAYGSELLRKPVVPAAVDEEDEEESGGERLVDWEDRILEDTVPLVGFVRMILHSGKYESGDKLSPEHESKILERLLPYHPECDKKIGCGVDYITVGYHPNFENSRCLFIVRKDGELVDFSFWKCIKGLVLKKYPLYADSFILKHFRRRRQ